MFISPDCWAATDDNTFNDCIRLLNQQPDVIKNQIWYTTGLDKKIKKLEDSILYGGFVVRWTSHKNEDGTRTYIILNRGTDPAPEDDPDGFDIFIERNGNASYIETFAVNAEAFLKDNDAGIAGIVSCTQGEIGGRLMWNGHKWD
jgi:hypothetical protein